MALFVRAQTDSAMDDSRGNITRLLKQWQSGDRSVEDELFALVLPDLRRLAHYFMNKERAEHTFQPTALVNETYIRLLDVRTMDWQNRQHFMAMAARMMRRCLAEYARARPDVQKEPEAKGDGHPQPAPDIDLAIEIDRVLDEYAEIETLRAAVVDLKFFSGFTDTEVSEILEISERSVQRYWQEAREWLFRRLGR
jgi:RNA polymerase sigma-70 factor, ECF subfamily